MKKLNVVLINSRDISKLYGIGSYLESLRDELTNNSNINVIYVEVDFGELGNVAVTRSKYTSVHITLQQTYTPTDISSTCASLIFYTILLNTNIKDGLFHLNVVNDLELCKVAKEKKFKVVFTQHTALFHESTDEYYRKKMPDLYSILDGCIFLCEDTKEKAIQHLSFSEKKSAVIYNGIKWVNKPSSRNEIRTRLGFRPDDFIAIFVGRLDRSKGINELIEAFKKFASGNMGRKLIIVGGGNFAEVLKMTKENISNFFFTGFLNKKDLSDFYQIADIGILPSYSEQSSLAVAEMIHNSIPLILSDISGFSIFQDYEVIKTPVIKTNGSISINVDSLSENIELLYNNESVRNKLVKSTLHYKETLMNIKYSTLQTIEFYKKILQD